MTNIALTEFAKIESDGKVKLIAKTATPDVDGYDLTTADGMPYHAHPVATPELWPSLEGAIADGNADVVVWVAPTAAELLSQAQAAQINLLTAAYTAAIQQNVSYMGTTFQADSASQQRLNLVITGCGGTLPSGFYWVDAGNNQVVMTFAELQGLGQTMLGQGWAAFSNLQSKKAAVLAAATVAAVEAISF